MPLPDVSHNFRWFLLTFLSCQYAFWLINILHDWLRLLRILGQRRRSNLFCVSFYCVTFIQPYHKCDNSPLPVNHRLFCRCPLLA